MKSLVLLALLAQVAPGVFTTIKTTGTTATSACIGCPTGSTTPATNSGMTIHTITLKDVAPSVTTLKLYSSGGALFFNGLSLATGSSIAGTTGTVPKFTAATVLGDSNATISGNNWTFASATLTATAFVGSGAGLTSIPTSAVSTGNYVATVASGTGITSSVTTGNAAATAISLNNTAVTPSTYGSSTAISQFTVDQQGRLTNATTVTPQLTLTSTFFSSLSGANLTGVDLLAAVNTHTLAGVHTWTGGTNAPQRISVINTTSGTAATASHLMNAGTNFTLLNTYSQGFTTSSFAILSSTLLEAQGANGLNLVTSNAAGTLGLWTNSLRRWGINAAGDHTFGASQNISDSSGTPTINTGFGTSPTIAGTDYAFVVTLGSAAGNAGGTVNFGHPLTNQQVCTASSDNIAVMSTMTVTGVSASSVSFAWTSGTYPGSVLRVLCRSY